MPSTLELPEALLQTDFVLRQKGISAEKVAWDIIEGVGDIEASFEPVTALKKEAGIENDEVEKLLLWHAAQQGLSRVNALPVNGWVRQRLDQELRQLHGMKVSMTAGSYNFNRAAKMATLRRFPAGPMEWEMSGVPRSLILKAAFPANLRLLRFVLLRLRGFAPCFFMHVAPAPHTRALSVPNQVLRAYYRMARSLELQPSMRALLAMAWFHDPAAVRDYPHLEVINRPYLEEGGLIVPLGLAPPSSGVLEGNLQRKADYIAGKVQYRYGFALWPRDAAIKWANAHPELAG